MSIHVYTVHVSLHVILCEFNKMGEVIKNQMIILFFLIPITIQCIHCEASHIVYITNLYLYLYLVLMCTCQFLPTHPHGMYTLCFSYKLSKLEYMLHASFSKMSMYHPKEALFLRLVTLHIFSQY